MTLIRFNPETAAQAPAWQAGDLLRDFMNLQFHSIPSGGAESNTSWSPALDVHADQDSFVVVLEAPGLRKEDFEISYHDGELSIAGERKQDQETKEKSCFRRERLFGRFTRTVSLPAKVKAEAITATYKEGILKVTLPKAEEAKPKQIEVNVN